VVFKERLTILRIPLLRIRGERGVIRGVKEGILSRLKPSNPKSQTISNDKAQIPNKVQTQMRKRGSFGI
jgi:hypothetical protein